MEQKTKQHFLFKALFNLLKTVGVCAGAYMILAILNNYGQKSKQPSKPTYSRHFAEKKADKIIEAKIETWR